MHRRDSLRENRAVAYNRAGAGAIVQTMIKTQFRPQSETILRRLLRWANNFYVEPAGIAKGRARPRKTIPRAAFLSPSYTPPSICHHFNLPLATPQTALFLRTTRFLRFANEYV